MIVPPGWEIYRDSIISIFEIDGNHYKVSISKSKKMSFFNSISIQFHS